MPKQKRNRLIYTIIFFLICVIVRSTAGILAGQNKVFFDELIHVRLSQSIMHDGTLMVRKMIFYKADFLYYVLTAPAFLFSNMTYSRYAIVVINSVLMSSSLFTINYFANRFLKKDLSWMMLMGSVILLPEMVYTMHVMQENLFFPLFLIYCVWVYKNLEALSANKRVLLDALTLGILVELLCRTKDAGAIIAIITPVFLLVCQKRVQRVLAYGTGFLVTYIPFEGVYRYMCQKSVEAMPKMETVLRIQGPSNSYGIRTTSKIVNSIQKLVGMTTLYGVKWIYVVGIYLVLFMIIGGFIWSVAGAVGISLHWERHEKLFVAFINLSSLAVMMSCIVLAMDEIVLHLPDVRFHYRYFFFFAVFQWLFFLALCEREQIHALGYGVCVVLIVLAAVFVRLLPKNKSHIDCLETFYFERKIQTPEQYQILILLLIVCLLVLFILLVLRKRKLFMWLVCMAGFGMYAFLSLHQYVFNYCEKQQKWSFYSDCEKIANYVNPNEDMVVAGETYMSGAPIESYLPMDCYATTVEDFEIWLEDVISGDNHELLVYTTVLENLSLDAPKAKYFLSDEPLDIEKLNQLGYYEVELQLNQYCLYERP